MGRTWQYCFNADFAKGSDINIENNSGNTALLFEAWDIHSKVVLILLANGHRTAVVILLTNLLNTYIMDIYLLLIYGGKIHDHT